MLHRRAAQIGTLLAATLLASCQGVSKLDPFPFTRAGWQHPEEVIAALELDPGDRVADVGAGEGYFVPYLSDAVGLDGRVYAVDVEADIASRLEQEFIGRSNVEVVLAEFHDPKLPDGQIDLVLLVNTYHHIERRPEYFARLRADLSSQGRVAIVEPNANLRGVLRPFVSSGHASSSAAIVREMDEAGYRHLEGYDFLPVQVFEVFEPR